MCSYGWKYFNNNCYLLSNYYNNFLGANDFCQDLNSKANIVMPKTQDVINFIENNWKLSYDFWVKFYHFIFMSIILSFSLKFHSRLGLKLRIQVNYTSIHGLMALLLMDLILSLLNIYYYYYYFY